MDAFFARYSIRTLTAEERVRALNLLELERNAMLMYTSCGWFFDDISGIETVQIITYAARVLELAAMLFPETRGVLEKSFTDRLAEAKSNDPQWRDGRYIYDESIRPMVVDLEQVAGGHAGGRRTGAQCEHQVEHAVLRLRGIAEAATGRSRLDVDLASPELREAHVGKEARPALEKELALQGPD